jgi:predicted Zn-dependent protease/molybdopterin converting factor small subunit
VPIRSVVAPIALVLLALACARNPVSGRPQLVFTGTAKEVQIGADAALEVEREIGLVEDAELVAYVEAVGARLALVSPRQDLEYRFQVVDMPEPNAFALPGGFIYVSRGLLALAASEDELAGVLAHEVVHVAARHYAERETQSLPIGVLAAAGQMVGSVLGGGRAARALGALPESAGALLLAEYGRGQEREADRVGQELAALAGWDPGALADFFERLEAFEAMQAEAGGAVAQGPSFFDSHPTTDERIRKVRLRAADLERGAEPPLSPTVEDFLRRLDGMRVGRNPAEGVFQDGLFLHPDLGFALRLPAGWGTRNTRDAVAAVSPEQDALLILALEGRGSDPEAALVAFARRAALTLTDLEHFEVNGLPAVRGLAAVETRDATLVADFTFIAYEGIVFRLTGAAPVASYDGRAPEMLESVASFRPLTDEERDLFEVQILRLERADPSESLETFAERTGSAWSAEQLAVMNGLEPGAPLSAGRLLKLGHAEPYQPPAAPEQARYTRCVPKVSVHAALRGPTRGEAMVEVAGANVLACLDAVEAEFPGFKQQVVAPDGAVHRFVKVFLNGDPVDSLDAPVAGGDEVEVLAAVGGG